MTRNFLAGVRSFRSGLHLCGHPQLRAYVLAPIVTAAAVFALLFGWAIDTLGRLSKLLVGWLPDWLDWLHWLLWPVVVIIALFLLVYGFVLLSNLIAAPFNGLLAERAEQLLTGAIPAAVPWTRLLRELPGMLGNEVRKIGYFSALAVPLLLLTLVPGINLLTGPLWLLLGCWIVALEYLDYPLGNHQHTFPAVRRYARSHREQALGFGSVALLASSIPLVNLLVMPAAVIGATHLTVRLGCATHEL